MTAQPNAANYPDILGAISRGVRLNIDMLQCAAAAHPAQAAAGQVFDLVLLLQNASDSDIDVTVETTLPRQDQAKQKDRFVTRSAKLLIGLRPAEVGALILPVAIAPNAQPAANYIATLDLKVKRLNKKMQRVRLEQGGGAFVFADLPEATQEQMRRLRGLAYSAQAGGRKDRVLVPFAVLPQAPVQPAKLKADYQTLWTMSDLADDYRIAQQVWEAAQSVVQRMKRQAVFMPLLKTTQERFEACGYPLLPPEAIYITKLLTLIAEMPISAPTSQNPRPVWPRWFTRLCRLLVQEPALANAVEVLVTRHLYGDLLYCAAMQGFAILTRVTREDFGTLDETSDYAEDLSQAVLRGQAVDFARVYLPLVLGGLLINTRVTMPREQVRETVFILSKALEKRQAQRTEANGFVFDIANTLIEQALDMA